MFRVIFISNVFTVNIDDDIKESKKTITYKAN